MKIVYQKLGLEMELNENQVQLLVIENEKIFAEITEQFLKFENNEETELVISEKDKLLQFHKIGQVVINPFGLSVNERKIIQKLYFFIISIFIKKPLADTLGHLQAVSMNTYCELILKRQLSVFRILVVLFLVSTHFHTVKLSLWDRT